MGPHRQRQAVMLSTCNAWPYPLLLSGVGDTAASQSNRQGVVEDTTGVTPSISNRRSRCHRKRNDFVFVSIPYLPPLRPLVGCNMYKKQNQKPQPEEFGSYQLTDQTRVDNNIPGDPSRPANNS
jgi:hypothetical protein